MAIALVQGWVSGSTGSPGTSGSVTLPGSSTVGNFIVVCFRNPFTSAGLAVTDITVTDDKGNTYVNAVYENGSGTFPAHQVSNGIWYCKKITTGSASPQITVTLANAGFCGFDVAEFSGGDATDPLDVTNTGIGTSTSPSSGSVTTAAWASNGLLVTIESNNQVNTVTDGSGWTRVHDDGSVTSDYQINAAGTYTGTWTLTINAGWEATIAAFKPASGGGDVSWMQPQPGLHPAHYPTRIQVP